jgi:hypothetical protein
LLTFSSPKIHAACTHRVPEAFFETIMRWFCHGQLKKSSDAGANK